MIFIEYLHTQCAGTPIKLHQHPIDNYAYGTGLKFYEPDKSNKTIHLLIEKCFHEIAHFVEVPITRLTKPNFGLPTYFLKDYIAPPVKFFFKAVEREIRTREIDSIIKSDWYKSHYFCPPAKSITMNESWKDPIYSFIENKSIDTYNSLSDFLQREQDIRKEINLQWNQDRVEDEFIKRTEYLSDWVETKPIPQVRRETLVWSNPTQYSFVSSGKTG